jgi:hypothetical protein
MDLKCIHCSELVDDTMTRCQACGGDPRVRGDADLIDLRDGDDRERENADLLASLVAAYSDAAPHERPRWGDNTSTPLELELEPIRLGQGKHPAADVLPVAPTRRLRRRS